MEDTDDLLQQKISWSFNVLHSGVHPIVDHAGRPWPEGSRRWRLAGKPLNPHNMFGVFAQLGGDWPWLVKLLRLPWHMNTVEICRKCKVHKHNTGLNYANAADDAVWLLPEHKRTNQEYIELMAHNTENKKPAMPPITTIIGFHMDMVVDCMLHDDLLGVRASLCGSALKEFAERGLWGTYSGTWKEQLAQQLEVAFRAFQHWQGPRLSCSQQPFKPSSLSMHTMTDWPVLKAKGRNCAVVSVWLAHVAAETADEQSHTEHAVILKNVLHAFAVMYSIFRNGEQWLSTNSLSQLEQARRIAMTGYNWLSADCWSIGQFHFVNMCHFVN